MSNRKGSRSNPVRHDRSKKRRFCGNRYTLEQETEFVSASAKKLLGSMNMDVPIATSFVYCILEFASVFSAISENVICKNCKSNVTFSQSTLQGLGFKINMSCECEGTLMINSCPKIQNSCEVNRRFVFVMRLLGIGQDGMNLFCSLMSICPGIGNATYAAILQNIHTAASAVYQTVLSLAVAQEKEMNKEAGQLEDEFTVYGDETWKKRGFSSWIGISSLVAKHCRKIIDTSLMSNFCDECDSWKSKKTSDSIAYHIWHESHAPKCTIKHTESSGQMEGDAIVKMFSRSIEKHGVKYVTYVGDGDSETFRGILKSEPYGQNPVVVKKECVEHVEKRMVTRLLNAKKNSEGIAGEEAGKLTDELINDLAKYYGLAIRQHADSIEEMKKAIWATFYHKCSTDANPEHENCPAGEDSWCEWRKAEARGQLHDFHHDEPPLTKQVQKVIKPIYEDLSRDELLTRCLGAQTQYNNESFNALIWTFAPKHLHSSEKIIEMATFLAVICINEGFDGILKVLVTMGSPISQITQGYAHQRDEARTCLIERRSSNLAKRPRTKTKAQQLALHDFFEETEGVLYGPAIVD